ncbi:TetR/AcrR family transcriptional regulator [Kitasatospora sp. NPDC049285]|uniref:TetR/AcrR family transcriptional regulator n=1 Tax=Kitasatospora sp. NPDC049285 TaxID=3157096 RepID=UPI0034314869
MTEQATPASADSPSTPGRPGRRRSEESRLAILAAAFELLGEVGYAGLTIEGIATRSGTGKQTIYRWWPSKADVLLEALIVKADLYIPLPDTGDHRADLHAFLSATFTLAATRPPVADALRALMAEAQIDARFGERFRDSLLRPRREALGTLVDRAHADGALAPHLTPDLAVDLVFGTLWYRLLATRDPLDVTLAEQLTATLLRAAPPAGS